MLNESFDGAGIVKLYNEVQGRMQCVDGRFP
jgi:hypothetical protein